MYDTKKKYKNALVLLSGGLDSATILAIAKNECETVAALAFSYGQRHGVEVGASEQIAIRAGVEWNVVNIDLGQFGGSALTSHAIKVPKSSVKITASAEIPVTYVPARNTIFLSYALALAEVRGAEAIYIGVNALDYSGYPDCRPEFIERFQALANVATKSAVEGHQVTIETPLIALSKAEIIRQGVTLGVDYSLTISCYDPNDSGGACGECDSCNLRRDGFAEAKVKDPTQYYSSPKTTTSV
ncbi:7-cyano-7-deazaguanine synthase QueC [Gemmatimonas aurantiaca]|nr:7-cyano-7-deazaguanine synthase QueC [Gemmatimonas aurantiaca]